MAQTYEEIVTQLTATGAPFEISVEPVRGLPMKNFKNRERSLREKIQHAAAHGDAECMVQGDRRIGYAEFARLVWGAAHVLEREFGLRRGDRLGVLAYNSPDWLIALFGATSLGGIGVGLNGWWKSEEIRHGLVDSGSRFLVVDERLYPRLEGIRADLPDLERVFYIGEQPPPGTVPIGELLVPSADAPGGPVDEDDPFVLLYTSGTTGKPKGCITTHRGTITQVLGSVFAGVTSAMLEGTNPIIADGGQTVSLLTTPLFHVGGLHTSVCAGLTVGTKLVFSTGRFDPEQVMALIERERVNVWGAVPTMLRRVVHSEKVSKYDLSSLRGVSFGGAPTPPETIEKAREVLPIEPSFAHAYGLTETHGVVTLNPGRALLDKPTSIGRPIPVLDIRLVDSDRAEVPDGALGELAIFGPTVTPGYWNVPHAENLEGGWLYTGDVAYRDREGFLFVVDRASDMILRGGENVYCAEIENALAEHPEIEEAAVIGVPDPDLGERVKAVVRRVPGSELSERAVRAHVAAHLADFKVPEFVEFVSESLPRNPIGKILKNILRGAGGGAFDEKDLE
jgi:long-chain acyl-CoA synthetase